MCDPTLMPAAAVTVSARDGIDSRYLFVTWASGDPGVAREAAQFCEI
jgi:hypothetical protein